MKILSAAWTIYDSRIEGFQTNCTGGGLVIKNICEYVGRKEESYLIIGSKELEKTKIGNINIVDTKKIYDAMEGNHLEKMSFAFIEALKVIKPDIVNCHGTGDFIESCIKICKKKSIPVVYTEHLYIGQEEEIPGYERAKKWAKRIYEIDDLDIVIVSSGIKEKILRDYPTIQDRRIYLIKNGTDFTGEIVAYDDVGKKKNKKILLCVGTLLHRKNQLQIVDVFKKMHDSLKEKIEVIFCGKDNMNGELQKQIIENNFENCLRYVGALSSEEMKRYYSKADGMILPSKAEGLSIAMLESMTYGLPLIMFSDSECSTDLNDNKVVCFSNGRDDESLLDAI